LKHVYAQVDLLGQPFALHYMRTKDGAEVDFCLVKNNKPELMIEAKRSDPSPGRGLLHFHKRYAIPGIQLALHLKREKKDRGIEIRRAEDYLCSLLI